MSAKLKEYSGTVSGSPSTGEPKSESSANSFSAGRVQPARTRFHLPRRREPGGGGDPPSQPMSDAGAGSCRYKGLGAAAVRPRARSAQRGPEGGREGGRGRGEDPTPGIRHLRAHRRRQSCRDFGREGRPLRAPRGRALGVLHRAPAPSIHQPPGTRPSARASPGSGPFPALEGAAASITASAASAAADVRAGHRREHRAPPQECTTPGTALDTDRARRAHKNGHCRYSLVAARRSREGWGWGWLHGDAVGGVGPGLARPGWGGRTAPQA